ncbi:SCO family protein [Ferriphaselus sp. R-1]|uniref:SCO family protein n=1 Tax=Ferriphaselus sp. R-1 TaxID=1485544 RepID=UPI00054D282D|nr:SCO family protein [Ferriphaselus sp. R-1]
MWLRRLLLLGLLALLGCEEPKLPSPFAASDVSSQYANADFHLQDAAGNPRSLADYRGKIVALFFGYTHCPDVCPTTLADLSQVMAKLGKDAEQVQVLFISLDPARDTPAMLAEYVPAFHPAFLGLSGTPAEIDRAAHAFGITWSKQLGNSGNYTLDHSAGTYLIDPVSHRVLLSPYAQRAELLAQDIELLLALRKQP